MQNFLYWPYDELTLAVNAASDAVLVKTPWLEASVPVTEANKENLQVLMTKVQAQELSVADMALVQWFFRDFSRYPFCYIVPSPKGQEASDQHVIRDERLLQASFSEVLALAVADLPPSDTVEAGDVPSVAACVERSTFEWDVNTALAFARTGDKVHPESLFSVIRRFHLLEVLQNDRGSEAFRYVESLPPEQFKIAAATIVRQNHYVTQKCQESLAPAVNLAGKARPAVEHFLKEEDGHDLILNVAIKALVDDPMALPLSRQTTMLMHLLRYAATRNFLAFAMIVDFFERSSYEKTDPMAQLLMKGGFAKAARQINRHMAINDAGEHENMGCSFLTTMAPCDASYAKEAMRLAEAVSLVMNSVTSSAVALVRQKN